MVEGQLSTGLTLSSFHRIGPLGRFDLVVAMTVPCMSPSHAIFFAWNKTGVWLLRVIREARPSAMRPSYYTRGALNMGGGCRAWREGGGGAFIF